MPKLVDHDEYRKELLEKCFSIFTRKGYSSVTMRDIAAEIGVSTGTLYHYFPTKESIMEHMFTFVQETNVNEFLSLTEKIDSIADKVGIFVMKWKEYESFFQSVMLLSVDVMRNVSSEQSEKIFINFSNHYTGAMSKELRIPESDARSLFIYLLGIIFHTMLTPNFLPYERQIDILQGLLQKVLPVEEGTAEGAGIHEIAASLIGRIRNAVSEKNESR